MEANGNKRAVIRIDLDLKTGMIAFVVLVVWGGIFFGLGERTGRRLAGIPSIVEPSSGDESLVEDAPPESQARPTSTPSRGSLTEEEAQALFAKSLRKEDETIRSPTPGTAQMTPALPLPGTPAPTPSRLAIESPASTLAPATGPKAATAVPVLLATASPAAATRTPSVPTLTTTRTPTPAVLATPVATVQPAPTASLTPTAALGRTAPPKAAATPTVTPSPVAARTTPPPSPSPSPSPTATPAPTPSLVAKPSPRAAPATEPSFTVQVASVKTRSDADVIMKQLTAHGYKPFLQEYSGKPSGKWYRIRVGHFATKAEADSLAFTLVHLEKLADSRVMREP